MIDDLRYIIIPFIDVTQEIIDSCVEDSFNSLRHIRFENDTTDWVALKWKDSKPVELWNEFPVYSDMEMVNILKNDLNKVTDGTANN